MSSRAARLTEALERVQRQRVQAELGWLRRGHADQDWVSGARALLRDEGAAELEEARSERAWSAEAERGFIAQCAQLAFELELAPAAPYLAKLVHEPFALPFGREAPVALVRGLMSDGSGEGLEHRARALGDATSAIAPRLVELRARALRAHAAQLAKLPSAAGLEKLPSAAGLEKPPSAAGLAKLPSAAGLEKPPNAAADSGAKPLPAAELARELLASTDDAAREMTRWLVRTVAPSGTITWHTLVRGLRAPELDGLASAARRWARVAGGLRGLGFERDLNRSIHAEAGDAVFDPRARVLVFESPSDVRVFQSTLAFGVMSDVYAAHGVGCGLAHALASPALPATLRRPVLPGVAEAIGTTCMQLRANREYLRRVDGLEPLWVERLARHAGVITLLEARMQAALSSVAGAIRGETEWLQQLTAALERALCVELPSGLALLAGVFVPPGTAAFESCVAGLAAHAGLRDRFDADWYRNPRVSEVLRGAAARGSTLPLATLLEELDVRAEAAGPRLIEILG